MADRDGNTLKAHRALALRGEIAGIDRTYLLAPGLNLIGSRSDRGVVLALRGVSKRHALLIVEPGRSILEDLGSKNGTFVNGERVERRVVEVGDLLRFGPICLRLEELVEDEGELAITLPATHRDDSRSSNRETSQLLASSEAISADAWSTAVERIVAHLPTSADADLGPCLTLVAKTLAADGVGLFLRPAEGPLVMQACSGPFEPSLAEDLARFSAVPEGEIEMQSVTRADGTMLSAALLTQEMGTTWLLVLWGKDSLPSAQAGLLRIALRLLARCREQPEVVEAPSRARRLILPEGHVRCSSPAMTRLYMELRALADCELPILILGETGVGKEGIARACHSSSPRCEGPFVALNCSAIPKEQLEAELFGIGKGVATGVQPRPGKFRLAEGGTLFLDEIGEMPRELQAKLLRALQEKEIQPVGEPGTRVDVRVIAATNSHLDRQIEAGRFRRDLYYRLAGGVLRVPPLRERREDIPLLVEHFLRRATKKQSRSVRGVSVRALRHLVRQDWPGNVRQLEHEVERWVALCADSQVIDLEMVTCQEARRLAADTRPGPEPVAHEREEPASPAEPPDPLPQPQPTLELAMLERRAVEEALRLAAGNQSRAAEMLGITRTSLYRRLRRYGLRSS